LLFQANDEEILFRPSGVIPTLPDSCGSAGVRESYHRRPLTSLKSDRSRLVNVCHKSSKPVKDVLENSITETNDIGSKIKADVSQMDWDGGRSELTRSWVIPAPNRTICHIWDSMPVRLDVVLGHLSPISVNDDRVVAPSSPSAVRYCFFPTKRTDRAEKQRKKELSSRDLLASVSLR